MNSLLALIAAFLVWGALCGGLGWRTGSNLEKGNCAQAQLAGNAVVAEQADSVQSAAAAADEASVTQQVKTVTQYRDIEREVIRYVQTHDPAAQCLGGDGLRIWAAANAGSFDGASAPGSNDPLPGAATAGERQQQRPAGEPRGSDAQLPRMQPAPGGPGELDTPDAQRTAGRE